MTPRRIVITGASLAGLRTADSLRANGFTGELVLIGDEPHEPYDRPPLSKAVLAGSGLVADPRGVECDAAGRALDVDGAVVPDVYVAGDVARWRHPHFDAEPQALQHWGNAVEQAEVAAHNLTHRHRRTAAALPAFWSDQFGLNIKSAGLPQLADQVVLTQGSFEQGPFAAAYGRGGVTVGAVAVDSPRVMDGYAALITERAPFPPAVNATDSPATAVLGAGFGSTELSGPDLTAVHGGQS